MPATVLVVDDEDAVRKAWEKALRHGGHHVLSARTAQHALELCEEHDFDVVVLDFIMPSIDGVGLLIKIRKQLPFVRSVIVSGKLDTNVSQSTLSSELTAEVEADLYLHKPVSNDDLRAAIDGLLKKPQATQWKELARHAAGVKRISAKRAASAAKALKARKKR